jgi:integrative and conjugative element protein (TIGR02256 family)
MADIGSLPRVRSTAAMIIYPIGTSEQVLVFGDSVVEHFLRHRQLRWWQREAGGQLFAHFEGARIVIEQATGPRRTDLRTRWSYIPDRRAEQREIKQLHAQGFHYVGDWHSHPEQRPSPSNPDTRSIAECVCKSTHNLNGFVLVVVGQRKFPEGLNVCVHDGSCYYELSPFTDELDSGGR